MVFRNVFFVLIFPIVFLTAGVAFLSKPIDVPFSLSVILPLMPYLLGFAALVLGWWFKSPRVVLMVGLLLGAHWAVSTFVPDIEHAGAYSREIMVIYAALAVLFPINAVLIAFMKDRGMASKTVLSWVLFILLQMMGLLVVWDAGLGPGTWIDEALHVRVFNTAFDYWSLLPQPAILLFAVITVVLFARAVWTQTAIDGGLFGAVAACGVALHGAGQGLLPPLMFTFACLGLLIAVFQESYRLAYIDELTNLPGRRALMHDLNALSGRYTVAMLDVDHFKKFNDTYGHDVGDQVLKLVASRMMAVTGGGRAFRYGGEEFTVLFAKKSAEQALPHLDKLRQAIAAASFDLRDEDRPKQKPPRTAKPKPKTNKSVSVTISIGAAESESGQKPPETLKASDQALYRAKDGGRNRVSV
ncbi:MAG: GGDEF domain-containing protein [Rhodospirillaceae bacterium]|nr:MAG: GGDEF domain-containing protein [Rhodospirillaceae bacterium]